MTLDFIEDACEILDKDDAPYILFVGDVRVTRIFSNIGEDNLDMLEGWLEDGHWEAMLREHIEKVRNA